MKKILVTGVGGPAGRSVSTLLMERHYPLIGTDMRSLEDLDFLAERISWIQAERRRQYEALCRIPYLQSYPSQGNFILSKVLGRDAAQLKNLLADQGILVRHFDTPALPNSLRVGVGRRQDTDRLIEVLERQV